MAVNVFDTEARLGLDSREFDRGMDESGKKANTFADILKANLVTKGIGLAVKGLTKLGGVVKNITTSAVESYAEYEQLVGGVETLFGSSAQRVIDDANAAFKSAGMSANQYMETSIQSAASLINSLGGDQAKAAELMNLSITDMSDNVNKMGTTMEGVQNAYRGFSRGNFTMLDNLALGFAGTKQGMQELLDKAMQIEKQQGRTTKFSIDSYSDIVRAIHVVQTEMGITGTTALEASKTISGSVAAVKSAWQNLITGIADENADFDRIINDFIDSVITASDNIVPRVEKALEGFVKLIDRLAPIMEERLPGFIRRIVPPLAKAAAKLLTAFAKAIIQNIPIILEAAKEIVSAVYTAIEEEAPGLMPVLFGIGGIKVASAVTGIVNNLGGLIARLTGVQAAASAASASMSGVGASASAASAATATASTAATGLIGVLSKLGIVALGAADAYLVAYDVGKINEAYRGYKAAEDTHMQERENALETYRKLVDEKGLAIANQWAQAVYGISSTTHNMHQTEHMILQQIEQEWKGVPQNLWDGVKQGWDHYFGANGAGFRQLLKDGIFSPVVDFVENAWDWGRDLIGNFTNGIKSMWESAKGAISNFAGMIRSYLGFSEPEEGPLSNFHTYAPDMMQLFAQGIQDNKRLVSDAINGAFNFRPAISSTVGAAGEEIAIPRGGSDTGRDTTIIFKLSDNTELGRAIFRLYNNESQRVGMRLAPT